MVAAHRALCPVAQVYENVAQNRGRIDDGPQNVAKPALEKGLGRRSLRPVWGLRFLITSGSLVTREQRCKISWTICRIPAWPFDYIVKAEKPAPAEISRDHRGSSMITTYVPGGSSAPRGQSLA